MKPTQNKLKQKYSEYNRTISIDTNYLFNKIQKTFQDGLESFYQYLASQCLGREYCKNTDSERFKLKVYPSVNEKILEFDGVEVGLIVEDFYNMKIQFTPLEEFKIK